VHSESFNCTTRVAEDSRHIIRVSSIAPSHCVFIMDNATSKSGLLNLNPHEPPPQELRDIFKLWKGSSKESINQLDVASDGMQLLGTIPRNRLETAYWKFISVPNDDTIEPVSIYGSADLPGRRF
jgi:hypothetical protein